MASVINSARNSTASVFDTLGVTANVLNQLVGTAARGVSALDAKTQLMHKRVIHHTDAQLVNVANHEIVKAAMEHADFMQELFNRQFPGQDFDWNASYNEVLVEITKAVKGS